MRAPFWLLVAGCGGGPPPAPPPAPVTVATVVQEAVPVELHEIGHVEPSSTVALHALVGGQISEVGFVEGQDVSAGDVLFVIEPSSFQAAVAKAEAQLGQQEALAEQASRQVARNEELAKKEYVSEDDVDKLRAEAAAQAALVRADEAALRAARIDLERCTIRSPIDGRTGALLVHPGDLAKANDTELVDINQVTPVFVDFAVPEAYAPEILARARRGETLPVTSTLARGVAETRPGTVFFVDNAVDATTGTLALKATFPNQDRALWPGQSTEVVLTLSVQPDAIVVPSPAVQEGQKGKLVYVVGQDDTVHAVSVDVDRTIGNRSVVSRGLSPGDVVVVDGQLQLKDGAKVAPKPAQSAAVDP